MYVTLEAREEQCDRNLPTDKDSLSYLIFDNYVNFEANNDGGKNRHSKMKTTIS